MLKKGRKWNCKFSRQEFVFTEGWICGLLMRATGGAIIFLLMAKQASKASLESLPWRYVHTHARTPMLSFVKHCNGGVLHKLPSRTRTVDWDQSREGGGFHYWMDKQAGGSKCGNNKTKWLNPTTSDKEVCVPRLQCSVLRTTGMLWCCSLLWSCLLDALSFVSKFRFLLTTNAQSSPNWHMTLLASSIWSPSGISL